MKQEEKFQLRGSLQTTVGGLEIMMERVQHLSKTYTSGSDQLEIQYELNEARVHMLAALNKLKHVKDDLLK